MTEDQMPRVPVQIVTTPDVWQWARRLNFDTRVSIGRICGMALEEYMQRMEKKEAKK